MKKIIDNYNKLLIHLPKDYPWFLESIHEETLSHEYEMYEKFIDHKIEFDGCSVGIFCAGLGISSVPILMNQNVKHVRMTDMDPTMKEIGYRLHGSYGDLFCYETKNVTFDYTHITPSDIYINTSCEHIYPNPKMFPGKEEAKVILSGNSLVKRGHINPINSQDELADMFGIVNVTDSWTETYTYKKEKYEQHTIIGYSTSHLHGIY